MQASWNEFESLFRRGRRVAELLAVRGPREPDTAASSGLRLQPRAARCDAIEPLEPERRTLGRLSLHEDPEDARLHERLAGSISVVQASGWRAAPA